MGRAVVLRSALPDIWHCLSASASGKTTGESAKSVLALVMIIGIAASAFVWYEPGFGWPQRIGFPVATLAVIAVLVWAMTRKTIAFSRWGASRSIADQCRESIGADICRFGRCSLLSPSRDHSASIAHGSRRGRFEFPITGIAHVMGARRRSRIGARYPREPPDRRDCL